MISFEVIKGCSPADSHIALWLARRAATQCRSSHYAVDELHQHHRLRGAVVLGHRPGGCKIKAPAVLLLAALAGTDMVGAEPVEMVRAAVPHILAEQIPDPHFGVAGYLPHDTDVTDPQNSQKSHGRSLHPKAALIGLLRGERWLI